MFLLCFESLELLRVILRTHRANTFGPLLLFLQAKGCYRRMLHKRENLCGANLHISVLQLSLAE